MDIVTRECTHHTRCYRRIPYRFNVGEGDGFVVMTHESRGHGTWRTMAIACSSEQSMKRYRNFQWSIP